MSRLGAFGGVEVRVLLGVLWTLGVCDAWADRQFNRNLVESLPGFFDPQTMLTDPVPISRSLAEWEPAEALLISIPVDVALNDTRVFTFYFTLIELASRYVDVAILEGADGSGRSARLLKRLKDEGLAEDRLSRIHFIPSLSSDFWVRDFGPVFGLAKNGNLIVFDNIYRRLTDQQELSRIASPGGDGNPDAYAADSSFGYMTVRRRSDVSPLFVNKFLRQQYQYASDLVRPPLYLSGGDYITDGAGRFLISEDTVLGNGGSRGNVEKTFAAYFGAKELLVLNAPPGSAAKHLDMLLCHPAPNTFILTNAPEVKEHLNLPNRRLVGEVKTIQEANRAYLLRSIPDAEIYTVPMPSLVVENRAQVMGKARAQIFALLCEEIGIDYVKFAKLPSGHSQRRSSQLLVEQHLNKVFGRSIDIHTEADLDLVAGRYLGADLATLVETNVESETIYRSYVNGLQVVTKEGQKVWFLPRYRARVGETVEEFNAMEQEVERVYLKINPDAVIHWIDADALAERKGAIHCVSMTLPSSFALSESTRDLDLRSGRMGRPARAERLGQGAAPNAGNGE